MARPGANLPEGVQLCRSWRPKDAVPRLGPESEDAGKSSFQVAKFHRAHQRGKVSAERARYGAILRSPVERRDQEDGGASKRRRYCLREGRRCTCLFGRAH